jgi:UDP-N-acetyl-D-glucosamine dehydrogenase
VSYHDPLVPSLRHEGQSLESAALNAEFIGEADLVVIVTDHSDIDYGLIRESRLPVVDTRNVLRRNS